MSDLRLCGARELELAHRSLTDDCGVPLTLRYYLLIEDVLDENRIPILELYGVRIEKERPEQMVSRSLLRVTTNGSEILHLVERLSDLTVMPEHLVECAEALFAENSGQTKRELI